MPSRRALLVMSCLLLVAAVSARAADVRVAVAANFARPMAQIVERFTAATGHTVALSVGSTGRLYSQIVAGAPFELLLAADAKTPERLVAEGHAQAAHRFTYAIGQLVLWSPDPGRVDADGRVLSGTGWQRLAIANPKLAPYGAAAMAVLHKRGLVAQVAPKLVTGDSIGQAFQFVATGNAELGFVALSQVQAPGQPASGSLWRVPQAYYPEIRQDVVLLRRGQANPAAHALLQFLRDADARALIAGYGYALAD
ncbi:molybdate ABC transporter substrate-binding protein [Rubrivivax albus]|uniref:Molybdate ABC transporter substrate-binding protein n=1 Tax=Rubrivivax albus TaxID=2499835 RepID=A0A437JS91_9BURK|nr:molybdate ABC transporter substrate-binding protein [Rubrivivax albus]RVT49785.1 molybdate ABC transporter substrate-binding protein [Rubrivivax albus]